MRAMLVVVLLELDEFPLEISRGPEQHPIQTFAPHSPNQSFDDRMGTRHVRHRLDFPNAEDPQIRLPLMKTCRSVREASTRSICAAIEIVANHSLASRSSGRWNAIATTA
jgi:hypothetical protein